MKWLFALILSTLLLTSLTYAGKAVFGMGNDMTMGSLECVNHCVDQTVTPSVVPAIIAFVFCVIIFLRIAPSFRGIFTAPNITKKYRRHTEPIRLFAFGRQWSTIMIRD